MIPYMALYSSFDTVKDEFIKDMFPVLLERICQQVEWAEEASICVKMALKTFHRAYYLEKIQASKILSIMIPSMAQDPSFETVKDEFIKDIFPVLLKRICQQVEWAEEASICVKMALKTFPSDLEYYQIHQLAMVKSNIKRIKILKYWFNKGGMVILSHMFWCLAAEFLAHLANLTYAHLLINKMSKKLNATVDECLLDPGSDSDDVCFLGEVTAKSKRGTLGSDSDDVCFLGEVTAKSKRGSDSDDVCFLGEVTAESKRVTISDSSSEDEAKFRNKRIVDKDSDDSSEEERRSKQCRIKKNPE